MLYAVGLGFSFLRAVFWSGGWYWRVPVLAAVLPSFRQEAQTVLDAFGLTLPASPSLYLVATLSLAAILGIRVALLETPRAVPIAANVQSLRSKFWVRADIKNVSFKDLSGMMCQIVGIDPIRCKVVIGDIDPRFVLTTQNRYRYWVLDNHGPLPQKRWHLDQSAKQVEVLHIDLIDNRILLPHEGGCISIPRTSAIYELELSGMEAGPPVRFWIWCLCFKDLNKPPFVMLARNKLEQLAYHQISMQQFGEII